MVKHVLMTDPRLEFYIEQNKNGLLFEDEVNRTLIFENPRMQPYAYKLQGMVGKIDEDRQRMEFECVFRDLRKDSMGRVSALVLINKRTSECHFETLTIKMERPKVEYIRIVEEDFDEREAKMSSSDLRQFNRPQRETQ